MTSPQYKEMEGGPSSNSEENEECEYEKVDWNKVREKTIDDINLALR